jgi:hypothetical protein
MAADPRLPALKRLSGMIMDLHLAQLRRAEAERRALLDRIATLSEPPAVPKDLAPHVAAEVAMRYNLWAELRRHEVEAALATKAEECEALQARARISVGRDGAVARLSDKFGR